MPSLIQYAHCNNKLNYFMVRFHDKNKCCFTKFTSQVPKKLFFLKKRDLSNFSNYLSSKEWKHKYKCKFAATQCKILLVYLYR